MSSDHSHDVDVHTEDAHEDPAEIRKHAYEHLWENIYFFSGFFALSILAVSFSSWTLALNPNGNFTVTLILLFVRTVAILYFFQTMLKKFAIAYYTITFTVVFLLGMIFLSLFAYWDYPGSGHP